MKRAVIVDCVRSPIGRAHKDKGVFREVRSDDLAVEVIQALIERTGIDRSEIEDVVMGNTQQQGEQGLNAARVVGLMAGLATHTGGTTVNFAELNRGNPPVWVSDGVCFSIHPQVHAFDNRSLVETCAAVADTVASARQFSEVYPIAVRV